MTLAATDARALAPVAGAVLLGALLIACREALAPTACLDGVTFAVITSPDTRSSSSSCSTPCSSVPGYVSHGFSEGTVLSS